MAFFISKLEETARRKAITLRLSLKQTLGFKTSTNLITRKVSKHWRSVWSLKETTLRNNGFLVEKPASLPLLTSQ